MDYDVNTTKTYLRIPDVKLEDEGLYKCEATYLSVNRECNNVQHITLTVNGKAFFYHLFIPHRFYNFEKFFCLFLLFDGKKNAQVTRDNCRIGRFSMVSLIIFPPRL